MINKYGLSRLANPFFPSTAALTAQELPKLVEVHEVIGHLPVREADVENNLFGVMSKIIQFNCITSFSYKLAYPGRALFAR